MQNVECWPIFVKCLGSIEQQLDLSRNQLNGIEDSQAIMLQKIKEVILEKNPLICDRCHMGALIQIAKNVSFILFIAIYYTCENPAINLIIAPNALEELNNSAVFFCSFSKIRIISLYL